jgi:hypothetical protein
MKSFRSPDGTFWGVEVQSPGSSNAMVVFHHPNGRTASLDRYAWYIAPGPEANNVTGRLAPARVLESLGDRDIARLFRRSMSISAKRGMVGLDN